MPENKRLTIIYKVMYKCRYIRCGGDDENQIIRKSSSERNFEGQLRFGRIMAMSSVCSFFGLACSICGLYVVGDFHVVGLWTRLSYDCDDNNDNCYSCVVEESVFVVERQRLVPLWDAAGNPSRMIKTS